jgi:tetratricopeptide (TPR) repeat protein
MTLNSQLTQLEASGLIQLVSTQPDLEYNFRHVLIQEAAYASLLKSDRRQLHLAVGEVLERLYPEKREELAGQLAIHFSEADEPSRAAHYFSLAGDRAARGYANREAVNLYTRALAYVLEGSLERIKVLKARAGIYEIIGEFDKADHDLESALQEARSAGQIREEWQVLHGLGLLWSARDYVKTGNFYQEALDLAYRIGTKESLAYSLNRMGNWYMNAEQSDEGLNSHQKALSIFEELADKQGIAETLDYLGMACSLRGEFGLAQDHLLRAKEFFKELENQRGFISSATSDSLHNANYQGDTFVVGDFTIAMGAEAARRAGEMAHEIGWRSGEMWAFCCQALNDGAQGEYGEALKAVQHTLEIGLEIEHKQWLAMVHATLGAVYYDIGSMERAQKSLETSLKLSQSLASQHWIHVSSGYLALVYLAQGNLDRANSVLDDALSLDSPARTMGQRLVWCARAELALGRNKPQSAREYIDKMRACTFGFTPETSILRLDFLEGQALCLLAVSASGEERMQQLTEAEKAYHKAYVVAEQQGSYSMLWRIHKAKAQLYRQMGRDADVAIEDRQAQAIIQILAEKIDDAGLRETFLNYTMN